MPLHHPLDEFDDCPDEFNEDPFDSDTYPGQVPIEKILEMYPPPAETSPPTAPQIEIIPPPPSQETPPPPSDPPVAKKKRGAPPGNLNALKHGLYVQGNAIYNTSPLERAQLFDLNTAVLQYKDYINLTYQNGVKQTEMDKINETMRNLSLAAIALTRLLNAYEHGRTSMLPFDRNARTSRSMQKIIEYFNNQIDSFMGKSDTLTDPLPEE